jgi:hypothetical protein
MRRHLITLLLFASGLAFAERPARADTIGASTGGFRPSGAFFFRLPPPPAQTLPPGFGATLPGGAPRIAVPPTAIAAPTTPAPKTPAPTTPAPTVQPSAAAGESPGARCRKAIAAAERRSGIPDHLLAAIGHVESGRRDEQGTISPWPWSINVEGTDHVFDTEAQAIAAVTAFQARGVRSIDVGCLQVNLMYHPDAFASLEAAFDPVTNANYAAKFLSELFAQSGSWQRATALYHSATPALGANYEQKVEAALPDEKRVPTPATPAPMVAMATGPGPIMLGTNAGAPRIIPMVPGMVGRGLDSYRAMPVMIVRRARS